MKRSTGDVIKADLIWAHIKEAEQLIAAMSGLYMGLKQAGHESPAMAAWSELK